MKYIPLRVHTVFSRGKGAVDPERFADFAVKSGVKVMSVSDPLSVISWERFRKYAIRRGLKFLPGTEIPFRTAGSVLLFPLSDKGYFSTVASLNSKELSEMEDVAVIYIPSGRVANAVKVIRNLKELIPTGNLYFGLEWNTSREILKDAKKQGLPYVWVQTLKWIGNPEKYKTVFSVFTHIPMQEIADDNSVSLYGPLSYGAISKRWGAIGRVAMKNTFRFANSIEFDFEMNFKLSGDDNGGGRFFEKLEKIVNSKIASNNGNTKQRRRAEKEFAKIKEMGFASYFLIASDISSYCRKEKIYYNIRGSAGSSYILYLLGLSKMNPMEHNLIFERFINSRRDELPDIDIDIDSSRREEVLNWVFNRSGEKVAFLSTHKFFRGRSALYEVARSYGFNPEESHKMSKEIALFASPSDLKGMGKDGMRKIYDRAALLEGVYNELSLHLGGVIFSDRKIRESFPVEVSPGGYSQIVWDKDSVERLKIFKLDLLGVRGFGVISPYVYGDEVEFKDREVWENIKRAGTKGCFQLESPLSRENLEKTKPSDLNELAISIAIIRPGPARSGMKRSYIFKESPLHPVLKEIFPYTRGTVIFEEQISILLHHISGWSLELSERVRRELKKRRGEVFREEFYLAGSNRGWLQKDMSLFWDIATDFSSYAFNHAHSISYAYSAYISAWMKYRFPVKFFTRLFNSGGGYYPLPVYIEEAKSCGVAILPPDVNLSGPVFSEEGLGVRTGLMFIKGVGRKLSSKILEMRRSGFTSVEDFISRTKTGDRELSALMAVSAFNSLGYNGFSEKEKLKNWKEYLGFVPDRSD